MNAIDYLRGEIKAYFHDASELQLSSRFAAHRRFNFYFKIKNDCPYLLYLNWDGEYDRFILKCLEFGQAEILDKLIAEYPENGAKTFNLGQPYRTVTFIYKGENRLSVLDFKGPVDGDIQSSEITGYELMQSVDPFPGNGGDQALI
jgi:hypothetical protein